MLNLKPFQPPPLKFNFKFQPPKEWLPQLRTLLDAHPQDDLASTEALCCRVVGDFTAGIVLHRLLYWIPRGIRSDNAIWKSDREWYAELNLPYTQMKRVRARLSPVVKSWLEMAQGAPTYHYQLQVDAFIQGIAAVLNCSSVDVKLGLLEKVGKGLAEPFQQNQESITIQHKESDERLKIYHPYLNRFVGFNPEISAKLAAEVVRLGESNVREVLERCDKSKGKSWQYVLRSLENASAPLRTPIPLYDQSPRPEGERAGGKGTVTDEMRLAWASSEEGCAWASRLDSAKNPKPAPPSPKVSNQWATDWDRAYNQLEVQLDRASFDTWLRAAHFLKFENGVYYIAVTNPYARDMLQHRLYRDIRRVLINVVGSPLELQFEVQKLASRPDDDELPIFKLLALENEAHEAEMAFYRRH